MDLEQLLLQWELCVGRDINLEFSMIAIVTIFILLALSLLVLLLEVTRSVTSFDTHFFQACALEKLLNPHIPRLDSLHDLTHIAKAEGWAYLL